MLTPTDYGLPHTSFRPNQLESIEWVANVEPGIVKIGEMPTGCHAKGQGILMYDGSIKKVEDIVVSDELYGWDGYKRVVIDTIRGHGMMYEIVPNKGKSFIVNEDHVLTLIRTNCESTNIRPRTRSDCLDGNIVDVSIGDYLNWSNTQKHIYKLFRVSYNKIQHGMLEDESLPVDPYFLGVILGDGNIKKTAVGITTADDDIVYEIFKFANSYGLNVRVECKKDSKAKQYIIINGIGVKLKNKDFKLMNQLRSLGLDGHTAKDKFIPLIYKTCSIANRLQILAGLIDTDGYLSKRVEYDYISKSEQLANDIAFIARSVGLAAYVKSCQKRDQNGCGGIYYRVIISGNISIIPCRIFRKRCYFSRQQKKNVLRTGFKIKTIGIDDFYGFTITGDGRYVMDDFTVTHNSGKSAIAMAQSINGPVVVLTKTKQLQQQYQHEFNDAIVLYGRSNYPCVHIDARTNMTAHDCLFDSHMTECPYVDECEYHVLKTLAHESERVVLNYAYWLVTYGKWTPTYLVLDEGHNLPEIILNHVGTTVVQRDLEHWKLPDFPSIRRKPNSALLRTEKVESVALEWLSTSKATMDWACAEIKRKPLTDHNIKERRAAENLRNKLASTIEALGRNQGDHWYIRSGESATYSGPGFICKPKTARYDAGRYLFDNRPRVFTMSATIGNTDAFATELGIADYQFRWVPNQWPPSSREVWVLDAPPMGRGSTERDNSLWDKQARVIYSAIQECPPNWSGHILVSRKSEAKLLGQRLVNLGLGKRIFVSGGVDGDYIPTNQQLLEWERHKQKVPNALCLNWWGWEGLDAKNDEIVIIAKVPFPSLGSDYEKARMEYDGHMYRQRAAWLVEQGAGRVRRGERSDYNINGEFNTMVAIADGSIKMIEKYLSVSFKESLVSHK